MSSFQTPPKTPASPAWIFDAHLSRNSETPMGVLGVLRLAAGVLPGGRAAPDVLAPPSLHPTHPPLLSRTQYRQTLKPQVSLTFLTTI